MRYGNGICKRKYANVKENLRRKETPFIYKFVKRKMKLDFWHTFLAYFFFFFGKFSIQMYKENLRLKNILKKIKLIEF